MSERELESEYMIPAIFKELCPNCYGDIVSERLEKGLPCEKCLPNPKLKHPVIKGFLEKIWDVEEHVNEINKLFVEAIGSKMWGLQRLWARRFLNGESFAMVAPTGSGKTTAQIIFGLYASANYGRRVLILLPTSLLVHQVQNKVIEIRSKLGLNEVKVAAYHSLLSEKQKQMELATMKEASIIITTPISLMKREELQRRIDIAFIDDVDSFLRRSKSVDIVLRMLGVSPEEIALIEETQKMESAARKLSRDSPEEARELLRRASELKRKVRENVKGQIVVSGATQTARRTKRVRLLSSLFGFTVGGKVEVGRNIVDAYVNPTSSIEEEVVKIVTKLGNGGLIFVPMDKGTDYVKKLTEYLKEKGVNAEAYLGARKRVFEKYVAGDIDVLVGIASYRSPLTRGIDLPERVRYAVFAGVPKFRIKISIEEFQPSRWLILLNEIKDVVYDKYPRMFDRVLGGLIRVRTATRDVLEEVRKALVEDRVLKGYSEFVRRIAKETLDFFLTVLNDKVVLEKLRKSPTITFGSKEGEYFFIIPDATAYIQASGRTSRLYVGGLTKGLSVVIVDEEKAFNSLLKNLKWLLETIQFYKLEEVDLKKILKEVDDDRRKVRLAIEGKYRPKEHELMKTTLFIVESPNKARTISRMFGKPTRKTIGSLQTYEVITEDRLMIITATGGHVLDLVKDHGVFGVKVVNGHFIPTYKPIRRCIRCGRDVPEEEGSCPYCGGKVLIESKPIINALRQLASQVDEILVGTDPDSEGEKIAWDVTLLLKPLNKNIWRIRFHEVTRRGLREAINNLATVNEDLVKAQIVRRIEDRWIGFSLSPILWKEFGISYLSAGRVQTPVLGWIADRTEKNKKKAELIMLKLKDVNIALIFKAPRGTAEQILKEGKITITDVKKEVVEVNPPPPYTTDSMLSEASRTLKLPAPTVMDSAQRLFEAGLITYHRTDSTTVSNVGISIAKDFITRVYGEEYFKPRKWEKPGAHECIRPTRPLDSRQIKSLRAAGVLKLAIPLRQDDLRLYDLVFKRFMMSQMAPAKIERVSFKLIFGSIVREFTFTTKILFEGFTVLSKLRTFDEASKIAKGEYYVEDLSLRLIPEYPLYSYSDVVDLMREKGIGRPSTYAKILQNLRRRGYILEVGKGKLVATSRGKRIYKFLSSSFNDLVNENRTKILQEKIDKVEVGAANYVDVLREFYNETVKVVNEARRKGVTYPTFDEELANL